MAYDPAYKLRRILHLWEVAWLCAEEQPVARVSDGTPAYPFLKLLKEDAAAGLLTLHTPDPNHGIGMRAEISREQARQFCRRHKNAFLKDGAIHLPTCFFDSRARPKNVGEYVRTVDLPAYIRKRRWQDDVTYENVRQEVVGMGHKEATFRGAYEAARTAEEKATGKRLKQGRRKMPSADARH